MMLCGRKPRGEGRWGVCRVTLLLLLLASLSASFAEDAEVDLFEVLEEEQFMVSDPKQRQPAHRTAPPKGTDAVHLPQSSPATPSSNHGGDHVTRLSSQDEAFVLPTMQLAGSTTEPNVGGEAVMRGMVEEEEEEEDFLAFSDDMEMMERAEGRRREEERKLALRIKRATTDASGSDAVDGWMITTIPYVSALADDTTSEYQVAASAVENQIKSALQSQNEDASVVINKFTESTDTEPRSRRSLGQTAIEFTIYVEVGTVDRVGVARALQTLRISGIVYQDQTYSVPEDPQIELDDPSGQLEPVSCVICKQDSYKECVKNNSESTDWLCQTQSRYYFDFGSNQGDSTLAKGQQKLSVKVNATGGIPINGVLVSSLYVSMNGLISFGREYSSSRPIGLPVTDQELLCGYWADMQLPQDDAKAAVWYQVYKKDEDSTDAALAMLDKGGDQVLLYANIAYQPVFMVVVTFEDVPPTDASADTTERANFQMTVISDGFTSYGMIVYAAGGMKWDSSKGYPVTIGYLSTNTDPDLSSLDSNIGNANQPGVWFFTLSNRVDNPSRKCLDWYLDELPKVDGYHQAIRDLAPCPSAQDVTQFSNNLVAEDVENDVACFLTATTSTQTQHAKRCCYTDSTGSFLQTRPLAGSFLLHHPNVNSSGHELLDKLPKQYCCNDSKNCDKYYKVRPNSTSEQINVTQSLGTGDPHITTLDGKTFPFNAVGEFWLADFQDPRFELQARTCLATNSEGKEVRASVFCAFAAKGSGAVFQVVMSRDRADLNILVDGQDLSLEFRSNADFSSTSDGLFVLRKRDGSVAAVFSNQISLTVNVVNRQLTMQLDLRFVTADPPPTGLLGNLNGDKEDDFIFPNGTTLPGDASERDLLAYGQDWAITDNNTLFVYEGGWGTSRYTNTSFLPIFLDDVTDQEKTDAETACGGSDDLSCIYDFIATKDQALAVGTKSAKVQRETNLQKAANNVPQVSGPAEVRVTQNQTASITFSASDEDDDAIPTYVIIREPTGLTLNQASQTAEWTVSDPSDVLALEVAVKDSEGAVSPSLRIPIVYCSGCQDRGTCNFDTPRATSDDYYNIATCECQPYYSGDDCEANLDACADDPCPLLTTCTDLSIEDHKNEGPSSLGYTCSDCPDGYVRETLGGVIKCVDVDECSPPNPCQQVCSNTIGSYLCSCNSGYRKNSADGSLCTDIDECQENTHNCEQLCVNTAGSYNCDCFPGYTPNVTAENNCVKDPAVDPCAALNTSCAYACTNESGVAQCLCPTGYTLTDDSTTCKDINECDLNQCSQNCANSDGSYTCSCYPGFELDADRVTCNACPANKYGVGCAEICDCRGRGTCDRVKGCVCDEGWSGITCSTDVNECDTKADACPASQICQNTQGSFVCVCPGGFEKVGAQCNDIDECALASLHNCDQICSNTPGSYVCSCRSGFTYNSLNNACEDIDECATNTDDCEFDCQNFPGTANCICGQGFVLNDDRRTCYKEEDPCEALADSKSCEYACRVLNDAAQCYCNDGYELAADGVSCADINECEGSNKCGQQCDNTPGNYQCSCSVGYKLQNDKRTCVGCDSNHWGDDCKNTCDCNALGVERCDRVTGCVCKSGWQGDHCESDVDECLRDTSCAGIASSVCVNTAGSFRCLCLDGYALSAAGDACEDVNECGQQPGPCDQTCNNTVGSYQCSCAAGFNSDGRACVDIDECLTNPCDQICRNTAGGFSCACRSGFFLDPTTRRTCKVESECVTNSCEQGCVRRPNGTQECYCRAGFEVNTTNTDNCADIDECDNSPCINGTCLNTAGSFTCSCSNGTYLLSDDITCQVCPQGKFGAGCNSDCTCVAANTKSCDPETGICTCREGWKGADCGTNKDECTDTPDICAPVANSECRDTVGSHRCQCNLGFFTTDGQCRPCDDVHYGTECSSLCTCERANTLDCNDTSGACTCKTQWMGENCTDDVDECSGSTDPCLLDQHEACRNTEGGYACDCVAGFARPRPEDNCTDINECLKASTCNATGGEMCVNSVGSYSCVCAAGYTNATGACQPCDDVHYGTECSSQCTCERANTADCNDISGACTCKPQWTGENCTDDVNECSGSTDPCRLDQHETCNNTEGGYACDCVAGYARPSPGDNCTATWVGFGVNMTLNVSPEESLENSSSPYYISLRINISESLTDLYRRAIGDSFHAVEVLELRNGSILVTAEVQVDGSKTDDPEAVVAKGTSELLDLGVLPVGDVNASVASVTVGGTTLKSDSSVCDVFTAFTPCNSTHPCTVDPATDLPHCREPEEEEDDLALVIGLAVGIPLIFLAALVIAVIIYIHVNGRRHHESSEDDDSDRTASIFAGKVPTMGSWRVAHRGLYAPDNRSVSQDSEGSGDGQVGAGKAARRGRSDFQDSAWYDRRQPFVAAPPRRVSESTADRETAGPWDYLIHMLKPYSETRPFTIQRPQVDGSPERQRAAQQPRSMPGSRMGE